MNRNSLNDNKSNVNIRKKIRYRKCISEHRSHRECIQRPINRRRPFVFTDNRAIIMILSKTICHFFIFYHHYCWFAAHHRIVAFSLGHGLGHCRRTTEPLTMCQWFYTCVNIFLIHYYLHEQLPYFQRFVAASLLSSPHCMKQDYSRIKSQTSHNHYNYNYMYLHFSVHNFFWLLYSSFPHTFMCRLHFFASVNFHHKYVLLLFI